MVPSAEENRLSRDIRQNPRTHSQFEEAYHRLDTAGSEAERKRIRRETGNRTFVRPLAVAVL
jgi:hypothetical protein